MNAIYYLYCHCFQKEFEDIDKNGNTDKTAKILRIRINLLCSSHLIKNEHTSSPRETFFRSMLCSRGFVGYLNNVILK